MSEHLFESSEETVDAMATYYSEIFQNEKRIGAEALKLIALVEHSAVDHVISNDPQAQHTKLNAHAMNKAKHLLMEGFSFADGIDIGLQSANDTLDVERELVYRAAQIDAAFKDAARDDYIYAEKQRIRDIGILMADITEQYSDMVVNGWRDFLSEHLQGRVYDETAQENDMYIVSAKMRKGERIQREDTIRTRVTDLLDEVFQAPENAHLSKPEIADVLIDCLEHIIQEPREADRLSKIDEFMRASKYTFDEVYIIWLYEESIDIQPLEEPAEF